jgi:VCBS repeat-containing protein
LDTQTFAVTVSNVNDAPTFTSTPLESAMVTFPYTYAITVVDVDAGDAVTIAAPTLPAWLTLLDHGDGTATLSGTPGYADVGDYAVVLNTRDRAGTQDAQSFTVTVVDVDETPTFTSAPPENATSGITYTYSITAVDVNVDDVLTISAPVLPSWLTLSDHGAGQATLRGQPSNADAGDNPVSLRVTDATGLSANQNFTITVLGINTPPVLVDDMGAGFSTDEDTVFTTSNVLANDHDSETALSILSFDAARMQGQLSSNGDGTFTYDPMGALDSLASGAQTVETFTYIASDGALTATAMVSITVSGINDAPTIEDIADQVTDVGFLVGPIDFVIDDVDTHPSTLSLTSASSNTALVSPTNISFGGKGKSRTVTITPTAEIEDSSIITITVSDGMLTATDTFILTATSASATETQYIFLPAIMRNGK